MIDPMKLSPPARRLAAGVIHRVWDWVTVVGAVAPDDSRGQRFGAMGVGSCIAFPRGPVFGEQWIRIGEGTLIGPHVGLSVGLGPWEPFAPDADGESVVRIGDRCVIGRGSCIVGRHGIDIGDDVWTGPNVYITDHNHTYADPEVPVAHQWLDERPVRIGSGSWLGAGVVVLPGAQIGRNVTVAAGTVVGGAVPDNSVIAGPAARVVRRYEPGVGWEPPLSRVVPAPEGWPGWEAARRNGVA